MPDPGKSAGIRISFPKTVSQKSMSVLMPGNGNLLER